MRVDNHILTGIASFARDRMNYNLPHSNMRQFSKLSRHAKTCVRTSLQYGVGQHKVKNTVYIA